MEWSQRGGVGGSVARETKERESVHGKVMLKERGRKGNELKKGERS